MPHPRVGFFLLPVISQPPYDSTDARIELIIIKEQGQDVRALEGEK